MDKLKNRIKYFAIGLTIGGFLVYFMFGSRGCAWLPENRVKNMIGEKEIVVGDSVLAVMTCLELNNDDIYDLLKDGGEVEFSESETKILPKTYYIEGYKDEVLYWAKFALYEEKDLAEVTEVFLTDGASCEITVSNEFYSTMPLPHKDVISIIESHEFRILSDAECQMEEYGIAKEDLFEFHKTAVINIERSEPRKLPNPFYIMSGTLNNKPFSVKYIIGENRTRIHSIVGEEPTDC
ncbi:MAG: hypothetical protein ACI8ZM_002460 [Crocinitomix sp.]|jgi:hypothetical protein